MGTGTSKGGICPDPAAGLVDDGTASTAGTEPAKRPPSRAMFARMTSDYTADIEQYANQPNLFVLRDDRIKGGTLGRFVADFLRQPGVVDHAAYVYVCEPHDWCQITLAQGVACLNAMLPPGETKRVAVCLAGLRKTRAPQGSVRRSGGTAHGYDLRNAGDAMALGAEYFVLNQGGDAETLSGPFRTPAALDEHLRLAAVLAPGSSAHKAGIARMHRSPRWRDAFVVRRGLAYDFMRDACRVMASCLSGDGTTYHEVWISVGDNGLIVNAAKLTSLGDSYIACGAGDERSDAALAKLVATPGGVAARPVRIVPYHMPRGSSAPPALLPTFPTDPAADGKAWAAVLDAARAAPHSRFLFWNSAGRDNYHSQGTADVNF